MASLAEGLETAAIAAGVSLGLLEAVAIGAAGYAAPKLASLAETGLQKAAGGVRHLASDYVSTLSKGVHMYTGK